MGWFSTAILGVVIAFWATVFGVWLEGWRQNRLWSSLVVGEVEDVHCSDKGCSLLVRRADSSTDWVWIPPWEHLKERAR